jgi:1-aminocyclopropane-1-carboxylate deaminase/D-cysteine desulfhydrase-like pyridoxal-dependent ACC family enzyme
MTYLIDRFPGLCAIPRRALVPRPTEVVAMPRLSKMTGADLWVKRDDATAAAYGGNKVRKLEYLLGDAEAQGADTLITTGAFGSHHVLATSIFGAEAGLSVHAALVPQPWHKHVGENLRADVAAGATLHPIRHVAEVPFAVRRLARRLRREGRRPYLVPHGGSTAYGALGYVEAGLELAAQVDARALPEPEAIYVALGSAGTAAGLAIGLAAAGLTTKIVAVRVTDRLLANRATFLALLRRTMTLLRERDPRFPAVLELAAAKVEIDATAFAPGYGVSTPETRRAAELAAAEGLVTDETYTARALQVMLRHAESGRRRSGALAPRDPFTWKRALFWQTLSSADLAPLLRRVPAAPRWAERYAGKPLA